MKEVAKVYLGNIHQDSVLAQKVAQERKKHRVLEVELQSSDRAKGRILVQSTQGAIVGIVKSRDFRIQPGDVFQTIKGNLVLVELKAETLMVLSLTKLINSQSTAMKLVRLGHLLGNQHYPIKIEGHKIYVRLMNDKSVLTKMIEELNLSKLDITWETVAVTDLPTHSHHPHHH